MNILHLFFISIIVSGSLYPVFALDTPQVCDPSSQPPRGRWPSSHIYIKDTDGNMPFFPLIYHTAILHDDDVWNTSTQPRIVRVTLTIQNQDGQQVFNQTQSLQMKACSGPESVKWRFVPIQIADYTAKVSDDRGNVGMTFNSMLDATKSQTVSSPLEQLRFGIDSHGVVCKQDLQLVIKSEDDSPACVKSSTATILISQGWTSSRIINNTWAIKQTAQETINLVDDHMGEIAMNKNGTVSAIETISMHIQNFPAFSLPVVFKVFYTNGTLYKTEQIPSDNIQPNGYYKYNLTISSTDASNVFGEHHVSAEYNGNIGEILIRITPPP